MMLGKTRCRAHFGFAFSFVDYAMPCGCMKKFPLSAHRLEGYDSVYKSSGGTIGVLFEFIVVFNGLIGDWLFDTFSKHVWIG